LVLFYIKIKRTKIIQTCEFNAYSKTALDDLNLQLIHSSFSFACPKEKEQKKKAARTLPLYALLAALLPHVPEWSAPFVHVHARYPCGTESVPSKESVIAIFQTLRHKKLTDKLYVVIGSACIGNARSTKRSPAMKIVIKIKKNENNSDVRV
jgi:hypothetical protein